ncbi:hypothetical protein F4861DRAFT_50079 [Xylaria intraflava]|nr:hypothetical protein F4861DRAFT_50079 [Xylaria intraflava]
MASSNPKPRIIAHMNKEHAADLKRYLRAFNGLSSSAAADAQLVDLTVDALTIKSACGVHTVRVSPPMKSLADSRARLVDMAGRAQETLGLSDIRIDRFLGPRGIGILSFTGVIFYLVSAAALALGLLYPGTPAWSLLDKYFPYGAAGFAWSVKAISIPVFLIHSTEAWWMARSRLSKYNVEFGSALWFKWVLVTSIEGVPAFARFDRLVQEERKKKDAAKH